MLERRSSVSSKESLEDVIIQQYKKNIDKRTHSKWVIMVWLTKQVL